MSNVVNLEDYKFDKLAVEVFDGCKREEEELLDLTRQSINEFVKAISDERQMNPCYVMDQIFRVVIRNASWEAANGNAGALDLLNYIAEKGAELVDEHDCRLERDDRERRFWRSDLYWHRESKLRQEHNKRNK